ncbi:hypothetical protein [Mesomycoplasma neurolyticum]|nr:hypothetical protein [Mesomycoplasma neurolyticum]
MYGNFVEKEQNFRKKIFSIVADIFGYRDDFQEFRDENTLRTNIAETEKQYYLFAKKHFEKNH